jgi:hypothetical protein
MTFFLRHHWPLLAAAYAALLLLGLFFGLRRQQKTHTDS